jgi:hypothetical protein
LADLTKKIFSDDRITLEDILAKNGETLKKSKVALAAGGEDLEFWDEGDVSEMQRTLRETPKDETTPSQNV